MLPLNVTTLSEQNIGIIATTIGHASFLNYMFPPTGKNAPVLGGYPRPRS